MAYEFDFEGMTGEALHITFDNIEVKLSGYHRGSMSGGSGTECSHSIAGPKVATFFSKIKARNAEDLAAKIPAYTPKEWQKLHEIVIKNQTDSFSWTDTDWG